MKFTLSRTLSATVTLAVALTCGIARAGDAVAMPEHVPGEVLVQFKGGTGNLRRDAALARVAGRLAEHVKTRAMDDDGAPGLYRVRTGRPLADAIAELERDPSVEFAEPNWIYRPTDVSNDTHYANGNLWGTYSDDVPAAVGPSGTTNQYGSQAEEAWAAGLTGATSVVVGIVDEGVDFNHPDLDANVWTNPFDPPDGVDNDGNGYRDDVHGWDFVHGDNGVFDSADGDDHGTHVAGTVGAEGGNAAGVAGMNWRVKMIVTKFLGPSGGTTSAAVQAIDYLTDLKVRHGLAIAATNNSWGSGGYSRSLHDAIIRAAKRNILTICAAGNDGRDNDVTANYPSNYNTTQGTVSESAATWDGVVAVAAIDRYGALASWSNRGATTVDLGAPGVQIASTVPNSGYSYYSGTSMATPHVTGAAALYLAGHPGALGPEIRAALLNGTPTSSLAGRTVTGDRLTVSAFAGGAPPAPVHDVAVTNVGAPASVSRGSTATFTVEIRNDGTVSETVRVTATDTPPSGGTPGTMSPAQDVPVAAGATRVVSFSWNTTGASVGTHTLRGQAMQVPGETDLSDNARTRTSSVVTAPVPVVTGILPNVMRRGTTVSMRVSGFNFAQGAQLTFENGTAGAQPVASNVAVASDGRSITAQVTVAFGPPEAVRYWDVVVRNPDGGTGFLARGLTVQW